MKILQYRGNAKNFGDELNTWLWPRLMPSFFDEDMKELFIGIGSTIGMEPKEAGLKIVFGAGFVPSYHTKPNIQGDDWRIYFVRGPRTAQRLNLDASLAISDSGILASTCINKASHNPAVVSFMPHWQSMESGNWARACNQAGVNLIDPRLPVHSVFQQMLRSKHIICEAMHGAILADALRIPWVPVMPINPAHREKWYDWAESLSITVHPERLWPSALSEVNMSGVRQLLPTLKPDTGNHSSPSDDNAHSISMASRGKRALMDSSLAPWVDNKLVDLAAARLRHLTGISPQLSADTAIDRAITRMLEKLDQFQRDYSYMPYKLAA